MHASGELSSLVAERPGPKGPSKLTAATREQIRSLRASGLSLAEVAARTGVSTATVRRATVVAVADRPSSGGDDGSSDRDPAAESAADLEPLARPADRSAERYGLIDDALPVICEGAPLPLGGAL